MDRIEVIAQAAQALRASALENDAGGHGGNAARMLMESLCDARALELNAIAPADVMLGGAYSRLQLWDWRRPELGGIIWLRDDLDPETRSFAIAHELGHFALHHGEGIALHPACDEHQVDQRADAGGLRAEDHRVEEYSPRVRRELEANAFAAELLAPRAEIRRRFIASARTDAPAIAREFGIGLVLARRRLQDAILSADASADAEDADRGSGPRSDGAVPPAQVDTRPPRPPTRAERTAAMAAVLDALDDSQRAAARAAGPTLVVAGPGTGKTATLVGRVAHLVGERDIAPERILAVTFSNRAAGEMRDRLTRAGLPGERMPVMTIHAFAANLLREYASHVPCGGGAPLAPEFRILDETDTFLLLEELLADLPLRFYRSLGNPTAHLRTLIGDFSAARDALLTPEDYLALVEAMPPLPPVPAMAVVGVSASAATELAIGAARATSARNQHGHLEQRGPPDGCYTPEQIGRARERARAYGVWVRALRQRGLVDFGGLIQRAVEMLRADADVLAEVRARYPEMLVDEFQDTNRAAGELLLLVAGHAGQGLWVVGDLRQSIHRWRGASPANLTRLAERYPHLRVCTLRHCYRSVPAIVHVGAAMAARMDDLAAAVPPSAGARSPAAPLPAGLAHPVATLAVRAAGSRPAVARDEAFPTGAHERAALAAAIQRLHTDGLAYRDQAVLCRTRKQVAAVAADLAAAGIPVAQPGGFFERPEVRDALGLLTLAAGPDARGLLLAPPLLAALGCPAVPPVELAAVARGLGAARRALPGALRQPDVLVAAGARSPAFRAGLAALGEVVVEIRYAPSVAESLARFLLRPGGYAWRLARMAAGLDSSGDAEGNGVNRAIDAVSAHTRDAAFRYGLAAPRTAADARTALAALGELVRLAARFDTRWTREPDFRARLSRAVRRHGGSEKSEAERREVEGRETTRPEGPAADTTAWPRTSDVLAVSPLDGAEDAAVGDALGGAPPSPPGEDTAPAVRCFLHYVDALRAAAAAIEVPAGDANAVQVLTLHRAKGLEFPVVFLPGLALGQFPVARPSHEDPCPPGFREADAPGEREAEERCLFYVGATRARDLLVVTRALSYGRNPGGGARRAEASPLLALLEAAPEWRDAPPLTPEGVAMVPGGIDALAAAGDTDDDDGADDGADDGVDEEAAGPAALGLPTAAKRAYPFYALDQYLECPRQYRYAHDYALVDPADSAVSRFHRFVRGGMRDLRDLRAAEPEADWERAEARLRDRWHTDGPSGHAYDAFYWRAAQAILRGEWQALAAHETSSLARATELAQKLRAELRRCVVEVTADRVIADGAGVILVRLHTGRPRKDDDKDLRLPLYYLAHRQEHPEVPVRVALAYVGDGLAGGGLAGETSAPDPAAGAAQGGLVDVTETARRAAEKYLKMDRLQVSALDKLDRAAMAIEAGAFVPRPREHVCAGCAYRLVCPADPGADP